MFDIGWPEMMIVALLALIVIGPKDLPGALRRVGQLTRKARGLAREFQGHFDDLAREADLEDARKAMKDAKSFNLENEVEKIVDPDKSIADEARDLGAEMRKEANAPTPAAAPADSTPTPEELATTAPEPEPAADPEPVKRRRGGAAPTVDDGAAA